MQPLISYICAFPFHVTTQCQAFVSVWHRIWLFSCDGNKKKSSSMKDIWRKLRSCFSYSLKLEAYQVDLRPTLSEPGQVYLLLGLKKGFCVAKLLFPQCATYSIREIIGLSWKAAGLVKVSIICFRLLLSFATPTFPAAHQRLTCSRAVFKNPSHHVPLPDYWTIFGSRRPALHPQSCLIVSTPCLSFGNPALPAPCLLLCCHSDLVDDYSFWPIDLESWITPSWLR